MSKLMIRPILESDEKEVVALWKECGLIVPQNDPHKDIMTKFSYQPELFLVGLLNNRIIATVMTGYEGHRGWINYLGVLPEYQRRGFARKMMEAAEEKLKKIGCPKINLQVRHTNKGVIEFYTGIGYKDDQVLSLGKKL